MNLIFEKFEKNLIFFKLKINLSPFLKKEPEPAPKPALESAKPEFYTDTKPLTQSNRKSLSMESIPSINHAFTNQPPSYANASHKNHHHPVVNIHNKYGTVSAYSSNQINRPAFVNINQISDHTTNLTSLTQNSINNNNNNNGAVSAAELAALANSNRLRPINRSFRTAVDKSFDLPMNSVLNSNQNNPQTGKSKTFLYLKLKNKTRNTFRRRFSLLYKSIYA